MRPIAGWTRRTGIALAVASFMLTGGEAKMNAKRLSPILIVDSVEDCLPFWIDRLGFEKTIDVPEGDVIGFAILQRDGVELMLQTRSGLAKDLPALAKEPSRSMLYLEVSSIDDIEKRIEGVEIVNPKRKTFYGATEIAVRGPAGNVVIFSEQSGE